MLKMQRKYILKSKKFLIALTLKAKLSRLNRNLGIFQNASADMVYLAERALYYNKFSGGLYDPRIIEILEKIGYDKIFGNKIFKERNDRKFGR